VPDGVRREGLATKDDEVPDGAGRQGDRGYRVERVLHERRREEVAQAHEVSSS